MAASPAEITVSFAGNVRLSLCDWLDRKSRLAQEIVKPAACDRITARVDDCCGLDVVGSRNTPDRGVRNRPCVIDRVSFISQYSNERRGIDNHFFRPAAQSLPILIKRSASPDPR